MQTSHPRSQVLDAITSYRLVPDQRDSPRRHGGTEGEPSAFSRQPSAITDSPLPLREGLGVKPELQVDPHDRSKLAHQSTPLNPQPSFSVPPCLRGESSLMSSLRTRLGESLIFLAFIVLASTCQEAPAIAQGSSPSSDPNAAILRTLKADGPAKALDALHALPAFIRKDPFLVRLSPAAAAVHRALLQLSSDEQYEILSAWTLPGDGSAVRVLTAIVPESAPPMEFARAIGERPQKESFGVASVGDVPGLFCSAWMLVTAADDSGNLRKLITELESRTAKKTAHADFVLVLARLRESRSSIDDLKALLDARVKTESPEMSVRMEDAVLLAVAMQRAELASVCEPLAEKVVKFDFAKDAGPWMTFLRRLRAMALLKGHSPESDAAAILKETPSLWIAAGDPRGSGTATGSDQALWLTHEDHLQKLSGPGDDLLLFRYPLTGKFELKGEVSVFEHGVAGMTYGGLSFDATDKLFTVRDVMRATQETREWPFVAAKELRMFNRLNIRSDGERVLFLSNLHPGTSLTTAACQTSPWLGLQASGFGRSYFRNLEIVGDPVIPREVALVKDTRLHGWTAPLGEPLTKAVQPLITRAASASKATKPIDALEGWIVSEDGVLESRKLETPNDTESGQRLLTWMRPLLEGETLRYEFFYEENGSLVHPVLGRLAFLLEPGGVRIRWITSGSDWTGLEPDHGVIEPLNRKGPRVLPLKPADWNAVSLQVVEGKLQITLNDTVIYARPVADLPSHQPGFYHDRSQTSARIRHVTLLGGSTWPEKLTVEQMAHPVAMSPKSGN